MQRKNLLSMKDKHYFNIEKLAKADKEKFWKKFNTLKNNNNSCVNIDIEKLKNHYENIFSNYYDVNPINKERILHATNNLNNLDSFTPIDLDYVKFYNVIKKIDNSKVCGIDKISSEMLKHTSEYFKNTYLFLFFKFIFMNCVYPDNFNTSYIKPIIKDHKKPNSDLTNLRPIAISNTLAQLFERLILEYIPNICKTNDNQFG